MIYISFHFFLPVLGKQINRPPAPFSLLLSSLFSMSDTRVLICKLQKVGWFHRMLEQSSHFMEKKSVNLPLIVTEGFSTVLYSVMYFNNISKVPKNPITGSYQKTDLLWNPETRFMSAWERGWPKLFCKERAKIFNLVSLRTGSQQGRKKIRRASEWESERRDSASEASGTRTPSSPDCSRLIPFALDCTRLSPTGACSQAIT